ncbi:MAG: hypothetical protein KDA69_18980 [Planctomycetaceae bacterium]|nr:hypothetical protein [Planctomycetaceae bacterium]
MFRYHCGSCGHWYASPVIGGSPYGEFLLRSESGETRYLNATLDHTFREVREFIENDPRATTLNQFKLSDLLHDVYGIACDKDSLGNEFRIGLKARCTHCDQRNITEWESVEPPEFVELEIPAVTHESWMKLDESEKQSRVSAAINESPFTP